MAADREPTAASRSDYAPEYDSPSAPVSTAASTRRCAVEIDGRPGARDGRLRCIFTRDHRTPHRFMAPDATLRWWPVELGDPPAWDDAITTPATDPRWPEAARA